MEQPVEEDKRAENGVRWMRHDVDGVMRWPKVPKERVVHAGVSQDTGTMTRVLSRLDECPSVIVVGISEWDDRESSEFSSTGSCR